MCSSKIWRLHEGDGPLVAMAIHDGHELRSEVLDMIALSEEARLREEDPFTGIWTQVASNRIVATRSRFEIELNRPRERAIYRTRDDAWGLEVWKSELPENLISRSLEEYDEFYRELHRLLTELIHRFDRVVVLDLHSYCHRREGPQGPLADEEENPQVNVGTGTMHDRGRWAPVIDTFIEKLRAFDFPGGSLDVRENVKFFGGQCPRWIHNTFPETVCVLSVEFKKFFMDEWTGVPDDVLVESIGEALRSTVPGLLHEIGKVS